MKGWVDELCEISGEQWRWLREWPPRPDGGMGYVVLPQPRILRNTGRVIFTASSAGFSWGDDE